MPSIAERNHLVESNLGLAGLVAKRYSRVGVDEDLFQTACLGLIKAAATYDPQLSRFSTHGYAGAKNHILRQFVFASRKRRSGAPAGLRTERLGTRLRDFRSIEPTVLAEAREELEGIRDQLKELVTVYRTLLANSASRPDRQRNLKIFGRRYGLDNDFAVVNLQTIADQFGLTREGVRQIVARTWTPIEWNLGLERGTGEIWLALKLECGEVLQNGLERE